ncbi:MAG: FG-GAP-like repeat-containing protein [Anaerolineae bacterium]|nr:FG-GAP-like repeat-containing protein [Anaerolineae bacterium]
MYAVILLGILLSGLLQPQMPTADPWYNPPQLPGFPVVLSGEPAEYSSVVLGDLDRDGKDEIVFAGRDGWIYAVKANGAVLWQYNVVPAMDASAIRPAGKIVVSSTPALADMDNDGWLEVVVGVGTDTNTLSHNGGVLALTHDGRLVAGWPQNTGEANLNGFTDGVWSSPAVGDLDGDGKMEIIVGGFDHRIYVWRPDGTPLTGWPRYVDDTVWASPALADLDKDGYLEIVIGSDCWGQKGGLLHAFRYTGEEIPGYPILIDQAMFSSPAIGDLDGDGWLDIVVGSGNYPFGTQPARAVFAFDRLGRALPGWPVPTDDFVLSSPTIGDINGDGSADVVVGTQGGKVYAIRGNGSVLPGWPVQARNRYASTGPLAFSSPVLGNFDADTLPEVFISVAGDVMVIDGNGGVLTHIEIATPTAKPVMGMPYGVGPNNMPAVVDLDRDGNSEVIRAGGSTAGGGRAYVAVWRTGVRDTSSPWRMWRQGARHSATYEPTRAKNAEVTKNDIPTVMAAGSTVQAVVTMLNTGSETWTKAAGHRLVPLSNDPLAAVTQVELAAGEAIAAGQSKSFSVALRAPQTPGFYRTQWRMVDAAGKPFGFTVAAWVKTSSEPALYVLNTSRESTNRGVYAVGIAAPITPPAGFENWWAGESLGYSPQRPGGYILLDAYGSVWFAGQAERVGVADHPWDPSGSYQQLIMFPQTASYVLLNKYGHFYPSSGALLPSPLPPAQSSPIVRSAAFTKSGSGVYMLDAYGHIYTGGNAQPLTPGLAPFGQPIAQRIRLTADNKGAYILDTYGRLWTIGTATPLAANYPLHMNEDWARDFDLTEDGRGYYLLDKEGGIHAGGTAAPVTINRPPTWPGQDIAGALVVADGRLVKAMDVQPTQLSFLTTINRDQTVTINVGTTDSKVSGWQAVADQPWISVTPNSGATPAHAQIGVKTSGLGLGIHSGKITFSSQSGEYPTITIPVQVKIVQKVQSAYLPLIKK